MFFWITVFCMAFTFIKFLAYVGDIIEMVKIIADPSTISIDRYIKRETSILLNRFEKIKEARVNARNR